MSSRPSIPFLLELLRLAMRKEASALYIVPWMPPTLRIDGRTVALASASFDPGQSTRLVLDLLDDEHRAALDHRREIEFDFALDGVGRFRVHTFRHHGQPAATIRPFATELPTPQRLALPLPACHAALAERGLLLLASPSASLRRDVLAALMEHRNRVGEGDLVLLDGAARFWHPAARCRVRHGVDAAAIERLLRQREHAATNASPLAIGFGELRDAVQLQQAVHLAGHALCLATLEAARPLQALQRLVAWAHEHGGAALLHRTAMRLHMVLTLRPVPALADARALAATQIVPNSPPLAADLAEGDLPALQALLEQHEHRPAGLPCAAADEHLQMLLAQGLVTPQAALLHALDHGRFARIVARGGAAGAARRGDGARARVDSGFMGVFSTGPAPRDPFDFAEAKTPAAPPDTQVDELGWHDEASTTAAPASTRPAPPIAGRDAAGRGLRAQVWAPPAALAGTCVEVEVRLARDGGEDASATSVPATPTPAVAAEQADLSVQLRVDDLLPTAMRLAAPWRGMPQRLRFTLPIPEQARTGTHAARVRLLVQGIMVGELGFAFPVRPDADPRAPAENADAAQQRVGAAYAAFADSDREAVARRLQPVHALAPDLAVFVEAGKLRSGIGWRERLQGELARSERLVLFWSRAAADSPWVDFEWRSVWRRRGTQAIDLVLLEPPALAPLPPELADLPG